MSLNTHYLDQQTYNFGGCSELYITTLNFLKRNIPILKGCVNTEYMHAYASLKLQLLDYPMPGQVQAFNPAINYCF